MDEQTLLANSDSLAKLSTPATVQESLVTAGQRKVNLIWEFTQAAIAVTVVSANIIVQVGTVFLGIKTPVPESLSNVLFLVVGFYFSRTNHAAIGGVGSKPTQEYQGR